MGASAKVTSKGQLTLPAALRAELDIQPGDEIVFFTHLDGRTGYAVDRRRDRSIPAIARYDGPPLDIRALDPAVPADDEPPAALPAGPRRAAR